MPTLHSLTIAESLHWSPRTTGSTAQADSDKVFTVPSGKEWRIQSVQVKYIAVSSTAVSGSSSNRQVEVEFRTSSDDQVARSVAGVVQNTDSTAHYTFAPSLEDLTSFRDTNVLTTPLADLVLAPNFDVRITDNKTRNTTEDDMDVTVFLLERDEPTT